ncbi:hypothetical protein ABIB15_000849 [Marisediminicola sp. UYEF4]
MKSPVTTIAASGSAARAACTRFMTNFADSILERQDRWSKWVLKARSRALVARSVKSAVTTTR